MIYHLEDLKKNINTANNITIDNYVLYIISILFKYFQLVSSYIFSRTKIQELQISFENIITKAVNCKLVEITMKNHLFHFIRNTIHVAYPWLIVYDQ